MNAALGFTRPSEKKKATKAAKDADKLGTKERRIVADVPEHIHSQLRIRCFERGVLVRDYLLALLAKDGIK